MHFIGINSFHSYRKKKLWEVNAIIISQLGNRGTEMSSNLPVTDS